MSSKSRELETLVSLIGQQYKTEEVKWVVVAMIGVVEILMDYYEIDEGEDEDAKEDLGLRVLESIEDVVHSWIVHNELPMTDEERTALQDQEVAELREQLKTFTGVEFLNLDKLFNSTEKQEEEKKDE